MTDTAPARKTGCFTKLIAVMAALMFMGWCSALMRPDAPATPAPVARQSAPAEPADVSPVGKVRAAVRAALGRQPFVEISDAGLVRVQFDINDNFTTNLIRGGALSDIAKILKAVPATKVPFQVLLVEGVMPLQDAFGKSTRSTVVSARYTPATLAKIQWPTFLTENVLRIADDVQLHPAFSRE